MPAVSLRVSSPPDNTAQVSRVLMCVCVLSDAYDVLLWLLCAPSSVAHMPAHTRNNTDVLDALGNTTAAIGKGFAGQQKQHIALLRVLLLHAMLRLCT